MRKITIGRNPDNNIVVNNNMVSRYHCEIIQEANQITLADLNSKNGTFVNGKRVYGITRLNFGDSVTVYNVPVNWQRHFTSNQASGQSKHKSKLNYIIPAAGAALALIATAVVALVLVFTNRNELQPVDIYFNGEYPPVEEIYYTENGKEYYFEAFKGQIVVFFDEHTSYKHAKEIIEDNGGKILSQIIDMHYFLVQVRDGSENAFIKNIELAPSVAYAFLHMPEYPCAMSAHVIDNTWKPNEYGEIHGQLVAATAMMACDDCVFAYEYNIADNDGNLSSNEAAKHIHTIFKDNPDSPILINTSYGAYLTVSKDKKIKYNELIKNDSLDQQLLVDSWVTRYINIIKTLIQTVKPYKDRDFIITKSAGNNGCPELDKIVLRALEEELTAEELAIMDNHILLVSAYDEVIRIKTKEDKSLKNIKEHQYPSWWKTHGIYSDRPKNYHRWVTTTDISHLARKDGISLDGTSFAAPNAMGNIARIIDKYGITAKEAMQAVKTVTKENAHKHGGAGILDISALDREAKKIAERKTNPATEQNDYKYHGVLAYRLVSMVDEFETLELVNTSNRDIRVVGYLQNAVASHDDDNRLDFDVIITANQTRCVNGYIANECVISSVENYEEKIKEDLSGPVQTSNMPDEYIEQYICTVTAYNSCNNSYNLDIYLANPHIEKIGKRAWVYIAVFPDELSEDNDWTLVHSNEKGGYYYTYGSWIDSIPWLKFNTDRLNEAYIATEPGWYRKNPN